MDRNLDIDNFELLLREKSDEFKMYPTKRIWHSIYNNIHPGRKWPSIAMSITLIAILLLVGYLNTNNKNLDQVAYNSVNINQHTFSVNNSRIFNTPIFDFLSFDNLQHKKFTTFEDNSTLNTATLNNYRNTQTEVNLLQTANLQSTKNSVLETGINTFTFKKIIENNFYLIVNKPAFEHVSITHAGIKNELSFSLKSNVPAYAVKNPSGIIENDGRVLQEKTIEQNGLKDNQLSAFTNVTDATTSILATGILENKNTFSGKSDGITTKVESTLTNEEQEWIENYALYNRAAPKKWAGKLGWQMYITPSVVYRDLRNTASGEGDINKSVIQHPSFGLEIGSGILYPILKGLKLKTGLQLNFTRYNAEAYGNSHPVATSILLHRPITGQLYPAYRSTSYSTNEGITPVNLHNETFQISIPIGVDVKLAGNENLQWYVGATIQPSYVLAGKSYLISTDKRNYIKESSLLNRFNLDAGFETFISYKTNNGFTLQFGPQFRKQLFTTNSKQYLIEERLNNYGFKFGISKLIK